MGNVRKSKEMGNFKLLVEKKTYERYQLRGLGVGERVILKWNVNK
jgi:hypothetical protein